MNELQYLFAGFSVFWAGLTVYLVWLQIRLRTLKNELDRLEERLGEESPQRLLASGHLAGEPLVQPRLSTTLAIDPEGREAP